MAVIEIPTHPDRQDMGEKHTPTPAWSGRKTSWWLMWGCLFFACIGAAWFSYQYFLVPQPRSFAPDWHTARWIQASDGTTPVAYFRSAITLGSIPDQGIITIAANQTFRLYVNTFFIGSNETEFFAGDTMRPYVYDITSALVEGPNLVSVRVANHDKQVSALRAALHFAQGPFSSDDDTGARWQATTNSALVFPRLQVIAPIWNPADFATHPWPTAQILTHEPALSPLPIDPALYQQALPQQWIAAGAQTQSYYLRQLYVADPPVNAWVRFTAAGPAEIFVNGSPVVYWDGTPTGARVTVYTLGHQYPNVKARTHSYMVGLYDIAPYLHIGQNTIAVYVSAPNTVTLLGHTSASLSLEVMLRDKAGKDTWSTAPSNWHVSTSFVSGWQQGSDAALAWPAPVQVPRPLSYQMFYMPDSDSLLSSTPSVRDLQSPPVLMTVIVVLASSGAVLLLCLLMSFILGKRFYGSLRNGMVVMSLAFLPALALEGLLVALAREPHFLQPFPYNAFWGLALITFVIITYLLLWLHAFLRQRRLADTNLYSEGTLNPRGWTGARVEVQSPGKDRRGTHKRCPHRSEDPSLFADRYNSSPASPTRTSQGSWPHLSAWFRQHWILLPLVIVASVLIFPALPYEPYWQDELVSYLVAKGSIMHGFPQTISGFIYPKAELFDYMLGIIVFIFGEQNGVPRVLSALEYIATIVLLYYVGMRFFNRSVGWLAAAMLTLSPYSLIWAAQERMYQQAQLCVLLMSFVFYIAVRKPYSVRWPYIAVGCLLLTYLSHELTFIALPAVVVGVLMISKNRRRGLPAVFYQKHWWFAALLGVCVIVAQLLIVKLSHPPVLGTDQTMRPEVQLNEDGVGFYFQFLFVPLPLSPWVTVNSLLAVVGCIYAVRSHNQRLRYCALCFVLSTLALIFLFTMRADRYFYPLFPLYYLVGAYALSRILQSVWRLACVYITVVRHESELSVPAARLASPSLRWLAWLSAVLLCGAVLLAPLFPISNNSLTISRLTGGAYHEHSGDFDVIGQYIKQHWQPGDVIISISPDIEMTYYVGHSDYYLSMDRALLMQEKNNHAVNNATGAIALFNQRDLEAVLSQYPRAWLVSDHAGYELSVLRRFTIPNSFHMVFEGARTALYLRGS